MTLHYVLLGLTVVLIYGSALAERRQRRELCDALAILAFAAFASALALNPYAICETNP